MIPIETQIFRLIFPPSGSIPLEKIEAVPLIRQHIDSIIDLASTEHGISSPGESAALTTRVIELRDTPGPDGKVRTWRTIAEICGTTIDAVRHRYAKATIRNSPTVETSGEFTKILGVALTGHPCETHARAAYLAKTKRKEANPELGEAESTNTEEPPKQENNPDEVVTIQESRAVDATPENLEKLRSDMEAKKAESLDPDTLAEIDRLLGEGVGVLDITAELEKKGKLVPWTKIRARAAYLGRMKTKPEPKKADEPEPAAQPEEEPQEAEAIDDRPEPVSISRKELDLLIWDMWRAGKTLDEISDILYSEGLYYGPKSVRVRLLSQGAKL